MSARVVDAVTFRENDGPDVLRFVLVGDPEIRSNGEKRDRGMVVELPSSALAQLIDSMGRYSFGRMLDRVWADYQKPASPGSDAFDQAAAEYDAFFQSRVDEVPK